MLGTGLWCSSRTGLSVGTGSHKHLVGVDREAGIVVTDFKAAFERYNIFLRFL